MKIERRADMTKDMWKNLNMLMEKMSSETMAKYIGEITPYRELVEKALLWEQRYQDLDLTETQRKIIDELLQIREKVSYGYAVLAWFSGVTDGITLIRKMEYQEIE